ncbi:unnamed protein product [Acanthosepion pharaonis]|uniref:Uncharacterized protein n=1 Tax=Acanthosepion pharaonis TaxID=158019 RepID=A0A812CAS9_ACAPH|nr:unnamed protein product [Sepia pharaonis]
MHFSGYLQPFSVKWTRLFFFLKNFFTIYETKYIRRSKLVIDPVKPEDAVTFTCINDVDSSKNVTIKLNVGVPYSTTQTTSTASQPLRSWTKNILLIFIVYTLCKIFLFSSLLFSLHYFSTFWLFFSPPSFSFPLFLPFSSLSLSLSPSSSFSLSPLSLSLSLFFFL